MMSLKRVLLSSLFFLALALSAWSIIISNKNGSKIPTVDPRAPDAFMQDVEAEAFDTNGKVIFKLQSPSIAHYPENNSMLVSAPRLTLYRQSSQPWHIQADLAKTKEDIHEIILLNNVNINHLADEENPTTTVLTKSLTVFTQKKIVMTRLPISLIQPDTTVHAVGMIANLNTGLIQLLSKAKGEYVPSL